MAKPKKVYDLIVIGSGPGGEKAAVKAAYFGYKVAIIEKDSAYGGAGGENGNRAIKDAERDRPLFIR